jgi:hypothetical protein
MANIASYYANIWILIGFLIYIVAVFSNLDSIRKLHGEYLKGYLFQKECGDEYTEYESFRRHTYEALKNQRGALDRGAYLFILLLFWVPFGILMLVVGHMIGISKMWLGIFLLIAVYFLLMMIKIGLQKNDAIHLYQYFNESGCDGTGDQQNNMHKTLQSIVFVFGAFVVYGFYGLHSHFTNVNNKSVPVFINKFPLVSKPNTSGGSSVATYKTSEDYERMLDADKPFGWRLYESTDKSGFKLGYYAFIFIWVMAYLWLYYSNTAYQKLRLNVLCYYEDLMSGYRVAVANFLNPPAEGRSMESMPKEAELEERFQFLKEHVERNYLRIHGSPPLKTVAKDNLADDYTIYLMNWKGREFEIFPDSPELNALRDYMYRLRNDRVYVQTLQKFFKFSKWYYFIHLVVIVYVLFHALYANIGLGLTKSLATPITIGICVIGILGLFVLSWYAWFDVALFA